MDHRPETGNNSRPVHRRSITAILKGALLMSGVTGFMRERGGNADTVRVLAYHAVADAPDYCCPSINVTPRVFEKQMRYVARHYNVISLRQLACHLTHGDAIPRKAVVITFDDGYRDNFDHAFPILKKYGLTATFFVVSEVLEGKAAFWVSAVRRMLVRAGDLRGVNDDFALGVDTVDATRPDTRVIDAYILRINQSHEKQREALIAASFAIGASDELQEIAAGYMMSADHARAMANDGMTIGSHSMTHPILTSLTIEQQRRELRQSRLALQDALDVPIEHFAYPNGPGVVNCTERTAELAAETGYMCSVCSRRGVARSTTTAHLIPRHSIDDALGLSPFTYKLEEHGFPAFMRYT